MATKRMHTYIVNVRWQLPDGSNLTRKIAENGLTKQSAKNKVMKKYNSRKMVNKLGKPTFISVTD